MDRDSIERCSLRRHFKTVFKGTHDIILTGQVLFRSICAYSYTYMHVTAISGKVGREFKEEERVLYRRVWREEREGGNIAIIHYNLKNERDEYKIKLIAKSD